MYLTRSIVNYHLYLTNGLKTSGSVLQEVVRTMFPEGKIKWNNNGTYAEPPGFLICAKSHKSSLGTCLGMNAWIIEMCVGREMGWELLTVQPCQEGLCQKDYFTATQPAFIQFLTIFCLPDFWEISKASFDTPKWHYAIRFTCMQT